MDDRDLNRQRNCLKEILWTQIWEVVVRQEGSIGLNPINKLRSTHWNIVVLTESVNVFAFTTNFRNQCIRSCRQSA
jgi:hypothetical protein